MPRIRDEFLDCSIFLYGSEADALAGADYGGSGFLVNVPVEPDLNEMAQYAVTNSHVVEHGCPVVRLNSKEGGVKTIPLRARSWIHHPDGDDIAIAPIHLDKNVHRFRSINADRDGTFFITEKQSTDLRLGAGDEIYMVGRFIGRDETQSNLPLVRFGHIAGVRSELINQGDDRRQFLQESFLVETHSISGCSGSPVFVSIPLDRIGLPEDEQERAAYQRGLRQAGLEYGAVPRDFFLGVDWGHLDETHFPGMAGVVPAWRLLELLYLPEVIAMRREERASHRIGDRRGRAVLDSKKLSTQTTHAGIEIGIPTKAQILNDLKKATRRKRP